MSKHYLNVRDWPKTVSLAAQARIAANVNEESHPAAKLYWWKEKTGTPEACATFCDTLVAGSFKRGRDAFAVATVEGAAPAKPAKLADEPKPEEQK
jgi:hypothetical protein